MNPKMLRLGLILVIAFSFCSPFVAAAQSKQDKFSEEEATQQINDFSLAGFGDKGKKTWDIAGKSADIMGDLIKLNDITGNLYGEEDNIKLTADKGDFNKIESKVHLENNVVVTSTSGAKLTTDSLDWDRKNQLVTTKDKVNIERDNMTTVATGATGHTNLNQVTLEKEVRVDIKPVKNDPDQPMQKIIITCDGPLTIDYQKNIATFNKNVKVDRGETQIYSDAMDVYFNMSDKDKDKGKDKDKDNNKDAQAKETDILGTGEAMGSSLDKIVARGNVKIVRGENVSYSEEATYNAIDKKIILSGKPRLIIYSQEDLSASFGN